MEGENKIMENITLEENAKKMDRIKTGIPGLDELIQGGFPRGSFINLAGGPGVGKTIFASQFLAEGIKNGEKGLFITVEQTADEISAQAKQFGWDFDKWENEGKLKIVSLDPQRLFEIRALDELKILIENNRYDRIVIDSITSFVSSPISPATIADFTDKGIQPYTFMELRRANVALLINLMKQHGITTLGISQKIEGIPGETIETSTEFKSDGLIVLNANAIGKILNRTLQIKKLRKTQIDGIPHNFDFTDKGISLK
ncbi:hypothetical protein B6U70_00935 [Euryarchaeota archaeon ex4484_162]|nr:MAG: hypothetical protein B6U70_00935 [Euryarchaeota archaeon ex4484_162]RLF62791.1 MAG: hypothetical protein DRN16_00590 [Thermoplasmata archaeon]